MLRIKHENQWIRAYESTRPKAEWICARIHLFECFIRLKTLLSCQNTTMMSIIIQELKKNKEFDDLLTLILSPGNTSGFVPPNPLFKQQMTSQQCFNYSYHCPSLFLLLESQLKTRLIDKTVGDAACSLYPVQFLYLRI